MKFRYALSVSVMAGAILLSSTACSPNTADNQTPPTNSPVSATASATVEATPTVSEKEKVQQVAQEYFDVIQDKEAIDKLRQDAAAFSANEPTEAEVQQFVKDNPKAFKHLDTSTVEHVQGGFIQLIMSAASGLKYEVTPESVTVAADETTASVDPALVKIYQGGKLMNDPAVTESLPTEESAKTQLVKKDGEWKIVPFTGTTK